MKGEYVSGKVDVGGDIQNSSFERTAIGQACPDVDSRSRAPVRRKIGSLGSLTSLGDIRSCVIPRVLVSENCSSRIRNLSHTTTV
jgi:hypothetical protein